MNVTPNHPPPPPIPFFFFSRVDCIAAPLNFVWLLHNALSLTISLLAFFYFILYPYLYGLTQLFAFFWVELSHFSLYECHINILCVSIIFVWMSHKRVSIFFVWMSHKYPCVSITSNWTLHFVSFWVLREPFLFLSCVHCHILFLTWKILLLYLFSQFLE